MKRLIRWWTQTGQLAREIVAKRVTIAAAAGAVLAALVQLNVLPTGLASKADGWVELSLGVLAAVTGALWARKNTTPSDPALSPTSTDGQPLVAVAAGVAASVEAAVARMRQIAQESPADTTQGA